MKAEIYFQYVDQDGGEAKSAEDILTKEFKSLNELPAIFEEAVSLIRDKYPKFNARFHRNGVSCLETDPIAQLDSLIYADVTACVEFYHIQEKGVTLTDIYDKLSDYIRK